MSACLPIDCDNTCEDLATFCVTDDVHMLPFGLYELVIKSGNCICGTFPVNIPKCLVAEASACDCNDKVCLPPRDCTTTNPEDGCTKEQDVCDFLKRDCGNKVGEHKLELDWRITAR